MKLSRGTFKIFTKLNFVKFTYTPIPNSSWACKTVLKSNYLLPCSLTVCTWLKFISSTINQSIIY